MATPARPPALSYFMHQFIRFRINIDYAQYLSVYEGLSKSIRVKADDGRVLDFPAGRMQTFLTREGIQGYFEMELTARHKFIALRRLD